MIDIKQVKLWYDKLLKEKWLIDEVVERVDMNLADFNFPGRFEYYSNRGGDGIVINIKGEGFPTKLPNALEKEIVKRYPKLKGFDREVEKGVEDFMEKFFDGYGDGLFWSDVQYETENFDLAPFEFTVTGRSGGYWGITLDSFERNVKWELSKTGQKALDDFFSSIYLKTIEDAGEDAYLETYDDFVEDFFYDLGHQGEMDWLELSKETLKDLENVEKTITGTVKYFEGNEKWLEEMDANDYWENLLEYIDIDFSEEE